MRIYIIGNAGIVLSREAPATVNDGEVGPSGETWCAGNPICLAPRCRFFPILDRLFYNQRASGC